MLEQMQSVVEITTIVNHLNEFKLYSLHLLNSTVHTGKHTFMRDSIGFFDFQIRQLVKQRNNLALIAAQLY